MWITFLQADSQRNVFSFKQKYKRAIWHFSKQGKSAGKYRWVYLFNLIFKKFTSLYIKPFSSWLTWLCYGIVIAYKLQKSWKERKKGKKKTWKCFLLCGLNDGIYSSATTFFPSDLYDICIKMLNYESFIFYRKHRLRQFSLISVYASFTSKRELSDTPSDANFASYVCTARC